MVNYRCCIDWNCSINGGNEIADLWNFTTGVYASINKDCCIIRLIFAAKGGIR